MVARRQRRLPERVHLIVVLGVEKKKFHRVFTPDFLEQIAGFTLRIGCLSAPVHLYSQLSCGKLEKMVLEIKGKGERVTSRNIAHLLDQDVGGVPASGKPGFLLHEPPEFPAALQKLYEVDQLLAVFPSHLLSVQHPLQAVCQDFAPLRYLCSGAFVCWGVADRKVFGFVVIFPDE